MSLERLFFGSTPPIAASDLGRGARLLVPRGAAFGVPQLIRDGVFTDWVRKEPDRYWVPGDRTSSHAGVDLAFFVRAGAIHALPEGLPVRAIEAGRVKWTGRRSDPESTHGAVLEHGGGRGLFLYSHYADIAHVVRAGERVERGQVLGHTRPYSDRYPVVLAHFGIGIHLPRWGSDPLDPTFLLRRWRVHHPLGPASRCCADTLNRGQNGRWVSPGKIDGLVSLGPYTERKSVYR